MLAVKISDLGEKIFAGGQHCIVQLEFWDGCFDHFSRIYGVAQTGHNTGGYKCTDILNKKGRTYTRGVDENIRYGR
jgi:hypothetical protein